MSETKFTGLPISILAFSEKYADEAPNASYHLIRKACLAGLFPKVVRPEKSPLLLLDVVENIEFAKTLEPDKKGPKFKNK